LFADSIGFHCQNKQRTTKSFPDRVALNNKHRRRIFYTGDTCALLVLWCIQCTLTPLAMQLPTSLLLALSSEMEM
jgi:hypothetical protein